MFLVKEQFWKGLSRTHWAAIATQNMSDVALSQNGNASECMYKRKKNLSNVQEDPSV